MASGTIRYWAAARDAAGTAEERYAGVVTLADALAAARAKRGAGFAKVLSVCSFLVDGTPVGGRDHDGVELPDGGVLEVLPPFAGG